MIHAIIGILYKIIIANFFADLGGLIILKFSKKVKSIEYDETTGILTIEFTAKIVKRYAEVPVKLYEELAASSDKTDTYQQKIEGQYPVL